MTDQREIKQFRLGAKRKRYAPPSSVTERYKTACKIRSSQRWRNLRALYLTKQPVCQDCADAAACEVHHIEGVSAHPELAFEWENLRALCIPCHEKRHQRRK